MLTFLLGSRQKPDNLVQSRASLLNHVFVECVLIARKARECIREAVQQGRYMCG
jgi:hypothetical protein